MCFEDWNQNLIDSDRKNPSDILLIYENAHPKKGEISNMKIKRKYILY